MAPIWLIVSRPPDLPLLSTFLCFWFFFQKKKASPLQIDLRLNCSQFYLRDLVCAVCLLHWSCLHLHAATPAHGLVTPRFGVSRSLTLSCLARSNFSIRDLLKILTNTQYSNGSSTLGALVRHCYLTGSVPIWAHPTSRLPPWACSPIPTSWVVSRYSIFAEPSFPLQFCYDSSWF